MVNLMIQNCSASQTTFEKISDSEIVFNSIIKIDDCDQESNDSNLTISMKNISFVGNRNKGRLIDVLSPERKCYTLVLEDVLLFDNEGASVLGYKNEITRLQLIQNQRFRIFSGSETSVTQLNATGNKGEIFLFSGNFLLQDSLIERNECELIALFHGFNSKPSFINSRFLANKCDQNDKSEGAYQGGVLFFLDSIVVIFNSSFINNSATDGGAIYSAMTWSLDLHDVIFDGNKATRGGAIAIVLPEDDANEIVPFSFQRTTFTNNSASLYGGAAFVLTRHRRLQVEINQSSFSDNVALRGGKYLLFEHLSYAFLRWYVRSFRSSRCRRLAFESTDRKYNF